MKKCIDFLIVIFILGFGIGYLYAQPPENPKKFFTEFILAEFNGSDDIRRDYVKYSPSRQKAIKKIDPEFMQLVTDYSANEIRVVESYYIDSIKVEQNKAQGIVHYEQKARNYIKDEKKMRKYILKKDVLSEKVKFNLDFINGKWWIIDPPEPRVSSKALKLYYDLVMKTYGDNWLSLPGIEEGPREYYFIRKNNHKFLIDLMEEKK